MASSTSRNETIDTSWLGTSIPTADFPGIGASILISFAARAKAISSCKLTILLTFTPASGYTSYFVIVGSTWTLVTLVFTPNVLIVISNFFVAVSTFYLS